MVPFLYSPREHHSARTPDDYRAKHAEHISRRTLGGDRVQIHLSHRPLAARIDCNTWLVDCECGAGNAVDPDWAEARCFGCGAVHLHVTFPDPDERRRIEAALLLRIRPRLRSWRPGETVAELLAENAGLSADEIAPDEERRPL